MKNICVSLSVQFFKNHSKNTKSNKLLTNCVSACLQEYWRNCRCFKKPNKTAIGEKCEKMKTIVEIPAKKKKPSSFICYHAGIIINIDGKNIFSQLNEMLLLTFALKSHKVLVSNVHVYLNCSFPLKEKKENRCQRSDGLKVRWRINVNAWLKWTNKSSASSSELPVEIHLNRTLYLKTGWKFHIKHSNLKNCG